MIQGCPDDDFFAKDLQLRVDDQVLLTVCEAYSHDPF